MIRNLLLSGGPAHDFGAASEALAHLLDAEGIRTDVVDDPGVALARLRASLAGRSEPLALLTVHALRWGMELPRYAELRAEHAYHLDAEDAALIDRFVRGGGGLLALHTAVVCFDGHPVWRDLCGAAWDWAASSHPPLGRADVHVTAAGRGHPITAGVDDFVVEDEVYGFLDETDGLVPLLTGAHGGREHPLLWAREVGDGRVVTDLLGHGTSSFEHPSHQLVLRRAAAWAHQAPGVG